MWPKSGNERAGYPRFGTSNAGVFVWPEQSQLSDPSRIHRGDTVDAMSDAAWNAASRKHYRAAVRLKVRAEQLYGEEELEAAAELLYMASKRAVNAVANSRSRNPISTRAKYRQLKRIAQTEPNGSQLLELWNAAWRLHTYADQMPERPTLEQDWRSALEFIAGMLALLPSHGRPRRTRHR